MQTNPSRKGKIMKTAMNTKLVIRSTLAMALAVATWCPLSARATEPTKETAATEAKTDRAKELNEQKQKMAESFIAPDGQLAEAVARMNGAPEGKKLDLIAAVVTQMVARQTALNARMEKTQEAILAQMLPPAPAAKSSVAHAPIKGQDEKVIAEQKTTLEANKAERAHSIEAKQHELMAGVQAQDAQLTSEVARMNSTPEGKKLDLIAAVVTQLASQRTAMDARMEKIQQELTAATAQPIVTAKESKSPASIVNARDDR
jgi:hypothetical protein